MLTGKLDVGPLKEKTATVLEGYCPLEWGMGRRGSTEKFFKAGEGGGGEEEHFERKMFVVRLLHARINACTHKNYTNMQLFLSSSFSRGLSSFLLCFITLFFLYMFWMWFAMMKNVKTDVNTNVFQTA